MIAALALVFDLILAGGRVVDGTGAPWFRADVGVRGDSIVAVGDLSHARARRRIDLHDRYLTPGFVDMLGQSELNLLVDPRAESKIRQGITTELTGEGVSAAPMSAGWIAEQRDWLARYKLRIDWTDLRGYFRRLRAARPAINLATLVGLGQVRGVVLGFTDVQPDADQLRRMEALVETAMKQGAFGVSTGLIYQPGSYAKTPELVALSRVAARHGGFYASHLRSEGRREPEALEEAFTVAREAHLPVEIWHLKVSGRSNWGKMKDVVARIDAARAEGLDVTADLYPYLASANGLDATIPDWAHAGGADAMVARLKDPPQRARILDEIRKEGFYPDDILLLSGVGEAVQPYLGKRLSEAARELHRDPAEALLDLVAMDRGNVGVARFGMSEDDVRLALVQPWTSLCTDYGARGIDGPFAREASAHPRAFGTTTRVLARYVRDEQVLRLEEAVRKLTSLPARRIGLFDRGLVRPGMKADLVVFDEAALADAPDFGKPLAYPRGITHVLVNGRLVLDDGRRTKARPGRALLHSP